MSTFFLARTKMSKQDIHPCNASRWVSEVVYDIRYKFWVAVAP